MSTFKNFVQCRVTTPITAVANSIGLYAVEPPYSLPSEEGGLLVLTDSPNNPSKLEVISYTTLTDLALYGVTRGLEGTTALEWTGPVYCYQSLLAGEFKTLLDSKVDKVAGKQLSDTNFTQVEKTKLAGIAAGAQANVATNLAQGARTTTTVIVTSSTGNNATLSAATTTQAGVMTSADKSKLDGIANIPSVPKSTAYTATASDKGKSIDTTTNVTIPASVFTVGDVIVVTNTSATDSSIIAASGVTFRLAGSDSTGVRTLAGYGVATFRMVSSNVWFVSGAGLS